MAFLDATIVNIAFPSIQASFPHVHRSWLSWVLNGYNLVFAALLVPVGHAVDRLGGRRVLLAGIGIFCTASVGCALAPSAAVLIALRAVQAVGAALMVPTSLALLLTVFPSRKRVEAIAVLSAAAAVAAAAGPSLGGFLIHLSDWRLVFAVNVPLGLAGLVVALRVLDDSPVRQALAPLDLPGTALFATAVAAVVLGLTQGPDWGWTDARTVGALGAASALALLTEPASTAADRSCWRRCPVPRAPGSRMSRS